MMVFRGRATSFAYLKFIWKISQRPAGAPGTARGRRAVRGGGPDSVLPDLRSGGLQLAGRGLAGALVAFEFEGDLLAFVQRAQAGALHGGDVHEHVRAALVRLNEAEALLAVEP